MTLPDEGPCDWGINWAEANACCRHDLDLITDEAIRTRVLESAVFVVWALSGRKYPGVCSTTRSFCAPCRPCSCAQSRCCCGPDSRIDLGTLFPVSSVVEVVVDGDVLIEGTDYRVDDWRWLVRLDGTWPAVVDLTDPEALEVTWTFGRTPPSPLRHAAQLLACEFAAPCIPGAVCNFPQRVTGVTAEGVTYTLVDPTQIIVKGMTGIVDVDMLIFAANQDTPAAGGIFDPGACGKAVATDTGIGAT